MYPGHPPPVDSVSFRRGFGLDQINTGRYSENPSRLRDAYASSGCPKTRVSMHKLAHRLLAFWLRRLTGFRVIAWDGAGRIAGIGYYPGPHQQGKKGRIILEDEVSGL